jgi:hypothetical protein
MSSPTQYESSGITAAFPTALITDPYMPIGGSEVFRDLPIPQEITGLDITYGALFKRLYESPEGRFLAGQKLRYTGHFGYEQVAMGAELGPDSHPIMHNLLTYLHVADLITQEQNGPSRTQLPLSERVIALIASGLHDMGESMYPELKKEVGGVVGDIIAGRKTDKDRAIEAAVRDVLWRKYLTDLPPELISRIEGVISHKDKGSLAHELFEVGHLIGSYRSGIAAGILALKGALLEEFVVPLPNQEDRAWSLSRMGTVVVGGTSQELEPFRGKYRAVGQTLDTCADVQDAILAAF